MAISCPRCGRQYDVTLFAWGRTIDCMCGARVGERHERRLDGEPRLLCDAMLGDLARWLRVLGLDAAYASDVDDATLVLEGPHPLFARCLECNTPLVEAGPEAVARRAPPHVRRTRQRFRACPDCGRVYWEGSHTERMRRRVRRALGWLAPDDPDSGGDP